MSGPLIHLPQVREQGFDAAAIGIRMRNSEMPLGFTFCPYPVGSTERANFLQGCIKAFFHARIIDESEDDEE